MRMYYSCMFSRLAPWLSWLAVPFLALALFAAGSEFLTAAQSQQLGLEHLGHPYAAALAGGLGFRLAVSLGMRRLRRSDPLEFIDTLEHELTHVFAGYLTFSPPLALKATLKKGGEVQLKNANPIAALAPYFLPLWCLLLLAMGPIITAELQSLWSLLILFLLGWYLVRLSGEFRFYQTDLQMYGRTFSTLFAGLGLLISVGAILHFRGLLPMDWLMKVPHRAYGDMMYLIGLARG